MNIPAQDVIQKLISDFGYKEQNAKEIVNRLQLCAPITLKIFEQWWNDGILDAELEVHGYTLKRLTNDYSFNPVNALLTMDWLLREPDVALAALADGYDTIEP